MVASTDTGPCFGPIRRRAAASPSAPLGTTTWSAGVPVSSSSAPPACTWKVTSTASSGWPRWSTTATWRASASGSPGLPCWASPATYRSSAIAQHRTNASARQASRSNSRVLLCTVVRGAHTSTSMGFPSGSTRTTPRTTQVSVGGEHVRSRTRHTACRRSNGSGIGVGNSAAHSARRYSPARGPGCPLGR